MKKVLSVFIAICVMLMTSITAFEAEAPSSDKVSKQIQGAVEYLTKDAESFGVDTAVDFSLLAENGENMSKFEWNFVSDVKANLDANNGKIISSFGENLTTYAAVIISLQALEYDTNNFYGYDIEKAFLAMDPTAEPASPNYYRIITQALSACYSEDAEDFAEAVCDSYVENYYTMGKGVDYYGFSCDNTAYFIDALTWVLTDKYDDILNDAINVIETYKVDGGYCFNPEYGTEPNVNSTALALVAHCSYTSEFDGFDIDTFDEAAYIEIMQKHFDKINSIYADLCTFEGTTTGVFTYDGEDNAYATKDALLALSYYLYEAEMQEFDWDDWEIDEEDPTDNEGTTKPSVKPELPTAPAAATTETTTTKANTSKKSPNTGLNVAAISTSAALLAACGVLAGFKKKER